MIAQLSTKNLSQSFSQKQRVEYDTRVDGPDWQLDLCVDMGDVFHRYMSRYLLELDLGLYQRLRNEFFRSAKLTDDVRSLELNVILPKIRQILPKMCPMTDLQCGEYVRLG
jgi:hypothetical protein